MAKKINDESRGFEKRIKAAAGRKYVLRLYVTGMTPRSLRAITNIKKICEEHLKGRYDLEVIDIYQRPTLAEGEQIIAAPTLIKKLPLPLRRFIGDMTCTGAVASTAASVWHGDFDVRTARVTVTLGG